MNGRAAILGISMLLSLVGRTTAQASQPAGWYDSDPAGLALEPRGGPDGVGYELRVSRDGASTRSELYKDGGRIKAWIKETRPNGALAREALEEGGALREELLFDELGRPELERTILPGGDVEERRYEYASGRLASSTASRGGRVVSTMRYLYAPDGRLALASESAESSFGTSVARSGGSSSWRRGPLGVELRSFDEAGRLVSVSSYSGAELSSREDRDWEDGALKRSVLERSDGTRVVTDYVTEGAASGEAARVATEKAGAPLSEEAYSYDAEGRLSRTERSAGGVASVVEYAYAADGILSAATTSIAGAIALVVRYESPAVRVEELYDGGEPFARVRYEDGRRTLEETIRDGLVVRSRSF